MPRLRLPSVAGLLAGAALLAAGCGGSSGGNPDADPAGIVPARATVYVEATLNPDGELESDVRALSQKLAGTNDPGAELKKLIEREVREEDKDFSYDKDIEPWLGDRAAIFVTNAREGEAAAVVGVKDAGKARKFLEAELAAREPGEDAPRVVKREHAGVKYKLEQNEETALAVVDDYALVGEEPAVRAALEARDGESLSETDRFKQARDQVPDDGLGLAYIGVSSLLSSFGPEAAAIRPLLGSLGETIAVSLDVDPDKMRFDSASLGVSEAAGPVGPGKVFGELPGSSWMAFGVADVGGTFSLALQQFGQLGALGGVDIERELKRSLGLDVQRDLFSWMGDGGVFVTGESLAEIGGGLVVEVKDPDRAEAALPRIERALRTFGGFRSSRISGVSGVRSGFRLRGGILNASPLPISVAVTRNDRFVVAIGGDAFEAAVSGTGDKLAQSPAYSAAQGTLGDGMKPQLFVDLAPVRKLVGDLGLSDKGEAGQRAQRALDALTTIVAGSRRDGDIARGRVVVGVK